MGFTRLNLIKERTYICMQELISPLLRFDIWGARRENMQEEKVLSSKRSTEDCNIVKEAKKKDAKLDYKLASPWLSHFLQEPLWPTEGTTRGNDIY